MPDPETAHTYDVDLAWGPDEVRVTYAGDLDLAARGVLVRAADRAVATVGRRRVVLDLTRVERIDSTGLRDVIEAVLRCDRSNAEWIVLPSAEVEKLLVLVRFGRRRSDGSQGWLAGGGYTEE